MGLGIIHKEFKLKSEELQRKYEKSQREKSLQDAINPTGKNIKDYNLYGINPINLATLVVSSGISPIGFVGWLPFFIAIDTNKRLKLWNESIIKDEKILKKVLAKIRKKESEARKTDINLLNSVFPIIIFDENNKEHHFRTETDVNKFTEHLKSARKQYDKEFLKYEIARNRDGVYNLVYLLFALWVLHSPMPSWIFGEPIKEAFSKKVIPPVEIMEVKTTTEYSEPSEMYEGVNNIVQAATNEITEKMATVYKFFGGNTNQSQPSKVGQPNIPQTVNPENLSGTPSVEFKGNENKIGQLPRYFMSGEASKFELTENGEIRYRFIENPIGNSESMEANLHNERLKQKKVSLMQYVDDFSPNQQEELINRIETGELVRLSFEISLDGKYLLLPVSENQMIDEKVAQIYFNKYALHKRILDCLQGEMKLIGDKFAIEIQPVKLPELREMLKPTNRQNSTRILESRRKEIPKIILSGDGFAIKNNSLNNNVSKDFFIGEMELTDWIIEQSQNLEIRMEIEYVRGERNFIFENEVDKQRILGLIGLNKEEIISKERVFIDNAAVFGKITNINEDSKELIKKIKEDESKNKKLLDKDGVWYENNGIVVWAFDQEKGSVVDNNFNGGVVNILDQGRAFVLPTQRVSVQNPISQDGTQSEIGAKLQEGITDPELAAKIRDWKGRLEELKVYQFEKNPGSEETKQSWGGHFQDIGKVKEIIQEVSYYISKGYYGKNDKLNEEIKNSKNTAETINLIISAIQNGEPITCQPAAFLTQVILQILEIKSAGVSGFLNGGGSIEEISVLTTKEGHAFVIAQITNKSGESELIIVESTPSQPKPEPTTTTEITQIATQVHSILVKDIPEMVENWLEILTKNPDKLGAGILGIIAALCLLIKTGKLNLKEISKEAREKLVTNATKLEEKVAEIQDNQKTKEKYPIKNQLEKLSENDKMIALDLLEKVKFNQLANMNLKKHEELRELEITFKRVSENVKKGIGLPNLRQEKYQNQLIQSLLETEIPNYYDRKAKLETNMFKLKPENQTLIKFLQILNSENRKIFHLQNPNEVLKILKDLLESSKNSI